MNKVGSSCSGSVEPQHLNVPLENKNRHDVHWFVSYSKPRRFEHVWQPFTFLVMTQDDFSVER